LAEEDGSMDPGSTRRAIETLNGDKLVGLVKFGDSSLSTEVEKSQQTLQKADGANGSDTPPVTRKEMRELARKGTISTLGI
jgi:hypothetical protein